MEMRIFNKDGKEMERKREDDYPMRYCIMGVLYIMKELLIDLFCMLLGFFVAACIMRLFYC